MTDLLLSLVWRIPLFKRLYIRRLSYWYECEEGHITSLVFNLPVPGDITRYTHHGSPPVMMIDGQPVRFAGYI